MKTLQKILVAITIISFFASCQTNTDPKQILANKETRIAIMDTIANNSSMAKEMMETMLNNKDCMMMMKGNAKMTSMMMDDHEAMMKMMKDKPDIMKGMMSDMMKACKNDSTAMSVMCKSMMDNTQMKDMMRHKMGDGKDMKGMKGM